ncbi:hypothetical protein Gasu2_55330 [Galdieria sulphuraria]|uniref:Zinc-finger protein / transcription factor isoform 1 n=1 Tax=Galdieria sulphuraria TaxID=130081 RepID=M2Y020_GALSU|nr:zinc-finger protein / transcription factor isoform 1 [Galdieria sulphuraria]EME29233.1 zinc-finger protein / transcription factor isoform 1 [Galdieria sulphuraria]GJD11393.1 hypothetical protein Gasu2_55330 [Galdieria sulphuraria]|eukprot:XP_005705753.1 zinc-finger protein / transcription factor isoform 1 [Galdieria sulphuraria]
MELRTYPPYYPTSIEYDIYQGHALCSSCGQLLSFPLGSALVQCPLCKTVLSLRPIYTVAIGGQTRCSGCHQNMLFPLGATAVQCTNCSSITHCPSLKYFVCHGCGLHLAYCASTDVPSVLCTVCSTLRDVISIEMESFSLQFGHKRVLLLSQEELVAAPWMNPSEASTQPQSLPSGASQNIEDDREMTQAPQQERRNEEDSKSHYMPFNPSC